MLRSHWDRLDHDGINDGLWHRLWPLPPRAWLLCAALVHALHIARPYDHTLHAVGVEAVARELALQQAVDRVGLKVLHALARQPRHAVLVGLGQLVHDPAERLAHTAACDGVLGLGPPVECAYGRDGTAQA